MAEVTAREGPPRDLEEYKLLRPLGRGAMGQVYLAHDTLLDRLVAIKFVARTPDAAARARFLIEARAAARLHHPNVVSVYRVGDAGGQPFIVSEFVRGRPLDRVDKPMASTRVLELALGLARGLAAAHRQGVLHRDIKPANAVIRDDGSPVLVDFGLAKLITETDLTAATQRPSQSAIVSCEAPTMTVPPDALANTMSAQAVAPPRVAPARALDERRQDSVSTLTGDGAVMGTPYYMAPEIWNSQSATARSDIYSLGAFLYELAAGIPPHKGVAASEIALVVASRDAPPLAERAPNLDSELAKLIHKCLERDPDDRPASADELCKSLELLASPARRTTVPPGNPYRGLLPFGAEHSATFFGRDGDIAGVIDRLRSQQLVIVAGESGVGKSSVIRAGVIPKIHDEGLGAGRTWRTVVIRPGRAPLLALASVVPGFDPRAESQLAHELADDPDALSAALRGRLAATEGLAIVIDQLEELVTAAPVREAHQAAESIKQLIASHPGVRVIATLRADHIGRLADLPGIGAEIASALYLVRPLSDQEIRSTIVGPAHATGVRFEPPELVDEIASAVAGSASALPLLQFALAELWRERDTSRNVITPDVLTRIGGVTGALTKHADTVVRSLPSNGREAARRVLLRLVTENNLRVARTDKDLGDDPDTRAALAALVAGRLLVAREVRGDTVYEVAHEALLTEWRMFREWVDEEAGSRVARERIAAAAAAWIQDGRRVDGLWRDTQLAAAGRVPTQSLSRDEIAFLATSQRAARRRRWTRRAAIGGALVFVAAVWGGFRWESRRELTRSVDAHVATGKTALTKAEQENVEMERERAAALRAFDDGKLADGEARWSRVLELGSEVDATLARASQAFEAGLRLDPAREDARSLIAQALFQRALLADQDRRTANRDEMLDRLSTYDHAGTFRKRWLQPGRLDLDARPSATVTLSRYQPAAGRLAPQPVRDLGATPVRDLELAPGSYVLHVAAPDRAAVVLPVLVERGKHATIELSLPKPSEIPAGFVYVPPGQFLFGDPKSEEHQRVFHTTAPLHERTTGAFLIARYETTVADWIEFLSALPPEQREQHRPKASGFQGGVELVQQVTTWSFSLFPTADSPLHAQLGEPLRYPDRTRRAAQDWRRFPVTGISWNDAKAYVEWLTATGRVPGARLCREDEWERAARGADDRMFTHGDRLAPDDANIDETYGRRPLAYGPDEVGSHLATVSPFGIEDMVGNAFEMCSSVLEPGTPVARGGAYYFTARTATVTNRMVLEPNLRNPTVGLRVCAEPRR